MCHISSVFYITKKCIIEFLDFYSQMFLSNFLPQSLQIVPLQQRYTSLQLKKKEKTEIQTFPEFNHETCESIVFVKQFHD